jgi:hypothetical protein
MRVRLHSPEEQGPWEMYRQLYSWMGAVHSVFQTNFPMPIQNSVQLSLEARLAVVCENSIKKTVFLLNWKCSGMLPFVLSTRVTYMAGFTSCSVLRRYNFSNQVSKCKSFVFGTEIGGHASKFEVVDVCGACLLLLSRVTDLSSSWLRTNLTRICMFL